MTLDQIIFHILSPKEGVDKSLILWGVKYGIIIISFTILYGIILFSNMKNKLNRIRYNIIIGIFFLIFSISFAHVKYDAISYIFEKENAFIENNYVKIEPDQIIFHTKQNAVIIILESMERTYSSEHIFSKNLIPRLTTLQDKNTSFSEQHQVYGTGWTIAGLTSYFFGVPLLLFKNLGNVIFHKYMEHAVSIFEVLEQHGYSIEYVLSGAAAFAGTDSLFKTHSHAFIQDSKFFEKIDHKSYHEYWGVPDSYTYRYAQKRCTELSKSKKPFCIIVQTLDTHGYDGRLAKEDDHGRGFIDVLDAADRMAMDFVEWLQQQPFSQKTTIIILGDHLAGNNPLYKDYLVPNHNARRIYNAFINPCKKGSGINANRSCSSFDMAPTILESIGAELPLHKFGLGTSLFSNEKTLVERYGLQKLNDSLKKKSSFYKRLFLHDE